jgi:hypothetical protein
MISMERIVGALFSGFMCRVYALGFAVWIAIESIETFWHVMHVAANAMQ